MQTQSERDYHYRICQVARLTELRASIGDEWGVDYLSIINKIEDALSSMREAAPGRCVSCGNPRDMEIVPGRYAAECVSCTMETAEAIDDAGEY